MKTLDSFTLATISGTLNEDNIMTVKFYKIPLDVLTDLGRRVLSADSRTQKIFFMGSPMFQELNDDFIDEFANHLDWTMLCLHQVMSYKLMAKHIGKLNFPMLSWNNRRDRFKQEDLENIELIYKLTK